MSKALLDGGDARRALPSFAGDQLKAVEVLLGAALAVTGPMLAACWPASAVSASHVVASGYSSSALLQATSPGARVSPLQRRPPSDPPSGALLIHHAAA